LNVDESGLQAGVIIGGYELDRRIGKGGMAEVWIARKARSRAGKFVAIKVILPHLAGQERYSRMFRHEADLSSMLSHSNVVQVFDEGEDNGISYLVMEYVDGINLVRLREALKLFDDALMRESIVAHVIGQLLHALSYAHSITTHEGEEMRIVHRDVSPQNVLLSNSGDVKLADFGVAHTVIEESSGIHIKGKLRYMSPEQLGGRTKDPTIDLFAAGAILHELLEGVKFRGEFEDDRVLYSQILSGAVPELSRPCSPELDRVRRALLAPEPEQRLQTADAALEMLRQFSGYRDRRLELSKICASLTGVARPRTGPGASPRATPAPQAGDRAPDRSSPSVAGHPPPGSSPSVSGYPPSVASHAQPGSSPSAAGYPGSSPPVSGYPQSGSSPSVSGYPQSGSSPPVAGYPQAGSSAAVAGYPQHARSPAGPVHDPRTPPTVMLDGQQQAPVPVERTSYLDGQSAAPPAEIASYMPAERTAYLEGGGLPPVAPSHPGLRAETTDTENRPHAHTIPDRLRPHGAIEADELSMTRFAVNKRGAGGMVGLIAGGVVLALGAAGVTGWWLTREEKQDRPAIAEQKQPETRPAAAAPTEPPPPADAEPQLVIGANEAPAEPEAAPSDPEPPPAPTEEEAPTEAEAEAPPETPKQAAPEDPPSSRPSPRTSRPRNRKGGSSAPEPTPSGPPVLVHFRKDGIDQAWVKIAGRSFAIESGTNRKLPSGAHRVYKKVSKDAGFAACGRFAFEPGKEWIVYVSAGSCRLKSLG
jgi:serine/threonine protein kinase